MVAGPPPQGSKRGQLMVAMAQGGKAAKSRRPSSGGGGLPPAVITFSRKPIKRLLDSDDDEYAEEGVGLAGDMQRTPGAKKARFESPARRTGDRPPGASCRQLLPPAAGAWGSSGYGRLHLAPSRPDGGAPPRLKDSTYTSRATDYYEQRRLEQQQDKQGLRAQRLEAERCRQFGGGSGGGYGGYSGGSLRSRLPAGMMNLGNTCYLNAVLQVLLSLPPLVADLRRGQRRLEEEGQPLSPGSVYAALLDCLAARDNRSWGVNSITPASLKRALDARSSAFRGALQQDAHELFCGLLDLLQGEVLAREVSHFGRQQIRIGETADPTARTFGFAVLHELTCAGCGACSRVVEQYTHLSLELPAAQGGGAPPEASVAELLRDYFKDEGVEKECERCGGGSGGGNVPHTLRHSVLRLPRVLVLHMKRFKVTWSAEQQRAVCQKLHTRVELPEALRLTPFLAAKGALPPLPEPPAAADGKENQTANAEHMGGGGSAAAAAAAAGEAAAPPRSRPSPGLHKQRSATFYGGGGGGGGGTPVATRAHLSPLLAGGLTPTGSFLQRRGTPKWNGGVIDEDEDAQLQAALAASLLDHQGLPASPAPPAFELQRHAAEQQEQQPTPLVRAGSPEGSAPAAEVFLPAELEAAAAAGPPSTCGGGLKGGSGVEEQWFMGVWGAARPGSSDSAKREGGSQGEGGDADLQRALEMSRKEEEERRRAEAAAADEDAELQRVLAESMADQGAGAEAAALAAAPSDGGSPPREQQREQQQQQQQPQAASEPAPEEPAALASPFAAAAVQAAAVKQEQSDEPPSAGEEPAPAPARSAAPYMHAEIVEDDAVLPDAASAAPQQQPPSDEPGSEGKAAAVADPAAAAAAAAAAARVSYRLQAVVNHQGPAASAGHFTADVADVGGRGWHCFNDSVASRISAGNARSPAKQRECYLVFYVAC